MKEPTHSAVTQAEEVFAAHDGVMRTSEALDAGIHRRTLYWMRDHELLETLSRGVFALTSAPLPENADVSAVMRRIPKAVLCLVSALDYHGIGTQIPKAVQVALPRSVRPPHIARPRVEVFNMADAAFGAGAETHSMSGADIRVFSVAKTVADCFRYRNRIGLDIAVEALQEVVSSRAASPAEIMEFARADRVASVMEPYVRALL